MCYNYRNPSTRGNALIFLNYRICFYNLYAFDIGPLNHSKYAQELPEETFKNLVDMVSVILRESNNEKEFRAAKTFVDLASMYYTVNDRGLAEFMKVNLWM